MIMSKVKITVFALSILVILSVTVWYFYSQLPPPLEDRLKSAEETAKWVKAMQWDLLKDSMSREEFEKGRAAVHSNKILQFLKDRKTLELPQIVEVLISTNPSKDLFLDLYWLEDGFSTEGIRITQIKEDQRETYELPIIRKFNFWDAESRREHKETALRFGIFPGRVGNTFALKNLKDSGSPIIVFPRDILESKILISIYDRKGNEGKPVELMILGNAREVILQEIGPDQD